MNSIQVNAVTKTYLKGNVTALSNICLEVGEGELFGLIGPDGAGKTSLFRILTTLLKPDSGTATVSGFDVVKDFRSIRNIVGYMPGKFSLYQDLSVEENLNFFATVFKTTVKENYHLIRDIYVQLEPFKTRRAGKLSGGMKQKLALCCALIHKPTVLFLDEPTTGVDAVSRKEFWEMLGRLKKEGITILVSTPYMDEASLCERIGFIHNGEILSINTPDGIIQKFPDPLYTFKSAEMSRLLADLRNLPEVKTCYTFGETLHVTFRNPFQNIEADLKLRLESTGHSLIEINRADPEIEDCFIQLMTSRNGSSN